MDAEDILEKMEFMANGLDCEVILLDPIQLALSGASNDEMEEFMSDLLKVAKRTNASIVIVSHVRKSAGGSKDISEGGRITESDLKGSSSLIQVAFNTIILERDKVNEDPIVKNTTRITIWKCRRTGMTGEAGTYFYDHQKGRLEKGMSSEDYNRLQEDGGSGGDEWTKADAAKDFDFDDTPAMQSDHLGKQAKKDGIDTHSTHAPRTAPIKELKVGDVVDRETGEVMEAGIIHTELEDFAAEFKGKTDAKIEAEAPPFALDDDFSDFE
jgi:hypothetical protein